MLERLTERVHYAPGGVNIGVIYGEGDRVILVDSGLNDTAARKVLRAISAEGRRVTAIVTTHGHADHFGGNAFIVKRTSARVYAPAWDEAVLRYPLLQPVFMFAGADPPQSLRGGILLAEASPVDVVYDAGPLAIDGVDMQAISLKGHSCNQMGILVDGVLFCADVVLPENVLARYKLPYLYAVGDHLASLKLANDISHEICIPGHGPQQEHASISVTPNREVVERVVGIVLDICREAVTPEDILARLLESVGADPADAAAFYLLHPTVFAFLSYLEGLGLVEHHIAHGRSLWTRT